MDFSAGVVISSIGLRYEGGLPGFPPGVEVAAAVENAVLNVKHARSGAILAHAPLTHILAVQAFPTDSALLNGWVGLTFGGATYLASPTFPGGSLVIVHAQARQPVQWGLGNRSGLFARKADYTFFCMMRDGLAAGASSAARSELGSDPDEYSTELGFSITRTPPTAAGPAAQPDAQPDVPFAMRQLNALRDEGLITQAEYAEKRTALLRRL